MALTKTAVTAAGDTSPKKAPIVLVTKSYNALQIKVRGLHLAALRIVYSPFYL